MSRLLPNPIAELLEPLQRLEHAIGRLSDQLAPVDTLPSVQEELVAVNETMTLVLEELRGLRKDLAER